MENLYTFNKTSWHVQFFKWMWGIDPTMRYKTMCPYFWQFIGSLLILPFIILWKFIDYVSGPIDAWIDYYSELAAEKETQDILFRFRSTTNLKDRYELSKTKCYKKYIDSLLDMQIISKEEWREFQLDVYTYKDTIICKKEFKKAKQQVIIDNIKYGIIGKIILYTVSALFLYFIFVFLYWFVHLFTFKDFIRGILIILGMITAAAIIFFFIYLFVKFEERNNCNGEFTKYNPFKYIIMIFKGFNKIIKIIFEMIGNLYKQNCPIITWKE